MALCPFATHKLIPPGSSDPRIKARAAILHVDAGGASSLYDYFRYRSGGIESHFHIKWTGEIEQYRDTDFEADANYRANPFAISIETQGFGGGKWNLLQLRSIKRLLLWIEATHEFPLQEIMDPFGTGVGYHTKFGAPSDWTPVAKSCPGPERIKQFHGELVPWMKSLARVKPKPRLKFRAITANLWRDNDHPEADLALLAHTKAHVIGLNEAAGFKTIVQALGGYKAVYGGDSRTARQTPILVRQDIPIIGQGFKVLSLAVGNSPERGATYVKIEHRGRKRAIVNLHANSHVQEGKANPHELPRVAEYIRGMRRLRRLVKGLEAEGYVVTIMGDFNWSFTRGLPQWKWAPKVVFGALGYRAQFSHKSTLARPKGDRRRIEYIFHHRRRDTILAQRFVSPEHSDHPFHEVIYTWED